MSEIYTDPPQSRNEAIIKATIDGTEYTAPPQSRMEDLLLELKEVIEQGGGGGTSDYPDLAHKPQVNGVELVGNKTSSDLGLMGHYDVDERPTEESENLISSKAVWEADEEIENKLKGPKTVEGNPITVTDAEPMNAESVVVELEPKQDLHGYDKPWAGGAGKNKLPLTVDGLKALNTEGTWSGNTYSVNGVTFELLTDSGYNVEGIAKSGTASELVVFRITSGFSLPVGSYLINGGISDSLPFGVGLDGIYTYSTGADASISVSDATAIYTTQILVASGNDQSVTFYPMIRLSTETDADFEPYSNICPITGYSEVNVERDGNTHTISLGGTKYGGILDVTEGGYSDEWGYISGSSVNDLVSAGMSIETTSAGLYSMVLASSAVSQANDQIATSDKLVCNELENTTANQNWATNVSGICINKSGNVVFVVKDITTQADMDTWLSNNPIQIAYRKKTPSSASTTPTDITLLENTNNISTDGTNITLKYQPNNVIGECKAYTDEKCAKVLPQPPTTDGTYHLECSVSGGTPTIRWVSNS